MRAFPAHTFEDVYRMPWYRFRLFLGQATGQRTAEYAPLRNEADEAEQTVIRMMAWQARRDAKLAQR